MAKRVAAKKKEDPKREVAALVAIVHALEELTQAELKRALRYLRDKYSIRGEGCASDD